MKNQEEAGTDEWFAHVQKNNAQTRLRLFCFPYAGGGALIFRGWSDHLSEAVEVWPVELPGRGARLMEPPATRLSSLVSQVAEALHSHLDKHFAFFGCSFGALLSFELARYLREIYDLSPCHLFVAAHRAPQLPNPDPTVHTLSDHGLLEKLRRFEGTPEEVLRNPELMELLLPTIRKDFEVCDTYTYLSKPPLACPISVFGGVEDVVVSYAELEPWREQTVDSCTLVMFPGGHLFINTAQSLLLNTLSSVLDQHVEDMSGHSSDL